MRRHLLLLASVLPLAVALACGGSDDSVVGGDNGDDGGTGGDGASGKDGSKNPGDASGPVQTYNDFTNPSFWEFFDIGAFVGEQDGAQPAGLLGAIFDGKYMYFPPTGTKTATPFGLSASYGVLRFDTTGSFVDAASYASMNLSGSAGPGLAYVGGTFDGNHVFLSPYQGSPPLAIDVHAPFDTPDASPVVYGTPSSISHFGAAFDGNYVYYAPITTGIVQRLDPKDGGLTGFDTNALDGGGDVYQGVVFDGRYAYFVPSSTTVAPPDDSHVVRLDTQGDFTNAASWSTFDTHVIDPAAQNFTGGVFDGKYVYFAPSSLNDTTPTNVRFVRYDTTQGFETAGAWQAFAPAPDAQTTAYHTAGFDGRYVYFLPFLSSGTFLLVRYDTNGTFGDPAAWTTVDTNALHPGATGFEGVGFDGTHLYFAPRYGRVLARFAAKTLREFPRGFQGSFL